MAKGITTTVTLPNGQIAKRTSKNGNYKWAVVIEQSTAALAAEKQESAALATQNAETLRAASTGEIAAETRSWIRGATYVTLTVGGEYAGSHTIAGPEGGYETPRPTDEALRASLIERAEQHEAHAAKERQAAAALLAGPASVYGVLRWSSRYDLAAKSITGEFGRLAALPGRTLTVVEAVVA